MGGYIGLGRGIWLLKDRWTAVEVMVEEVAVVVERQSWVVVEVCMNLMTGLTAIQSKEVVD